MILDEWERFKSVMFNPEQQQSEPAMKLAEKCFMAGCISALNVVVLETESMSLEDATAHCSLAQSQVIGRLRALQ